MGKRIAKKVLLIGWDAADWKVISPLMDAGHMPTLQKLVEGGVMGNLATLDPPLSPMLWTSISTGKRPYKHGIHGFTEPDPSGKGVRPCFITSRKVKAIWNIFNQHGLKSHVVGWWPSHPAEPINGTMISNFYQKATKPINDVWEMAPGTVHPKEKAEFFSKLRIHPSEITAAHILPFIPDASKVDQEKDKRLGMLTKILADCSTIHAAATYILEHEEWDFMGVYFDAIDHFCHGFMKFHPPQLPGISDDMYNLYKDVVISGYKFHDMMLERLIELAGKDVTIMLISDHGFHPDHLRPLKLPKEPAAPALEHSPYGIVVINGPNIKKDERIYGASILDVTPTILTMYGLPVGSDMDGNVMVNAFKDEIVPEKIPSWEDIEGDSGQHPKDMQEDPYEAAAAMEQLIALGYVEKPDENAEKAIKKTIAENSYYLARAYINGRKYEEAIELLLKINEEFPNTSRYILRLAHCYQMTNKTSECHALIDIYKKDNEGKDAIAIKIIEGNLFLAENKPKLALDIFEEVEKSSQGAARLNLQLGKVYLQLKKWKKAEKAFKAELEFDPGSAHAFHGLGVSQLKQLNYEEAIDNLLNTVGLMYHFPFAHYHLGEALYGIGEYEKSAEAFEVCLKMSPGINKARMWLNKIYGENLEKPKEALDIKEKIKDYIKGSIVVVSGLPRSGTSMMMQMLAAGGLDIYSDGVRKSDTNNPKGYFEHEAVKGLQKNKSWVNDAEGKAVKIISHLLFELPAKYHYKIIFMERNLDEIILSQHKMLVRDGKVKEGTVNLKVMSAFKQNLDRVKTWVPQQGYMEILYVSHANMINNPKEELQKVSAFLGGNLNLDTMAAVVDKNLHREKIQA